MRALLLVTTLLLPSREPARPHTGDLLPARVSVRADSDSVLVMGILTDLAAAFDEVARRNGYDQDAAIDGWLDLPYMASASSRPDVADYFTRRGAFAADLAAHMDSIATIVVKRRLDGAGMRVLEADSMRAAFLRGFHKNGAKQAMILESMRRQSRVALRLHEFLVKADAHIALNPKTNTLVFDRPADKRRYDELAIAIDAANEQLEQAAGQSPAASGQR